MPLDLQIIRASEFICIGARGQLDFELSKQALRALALACRKRGINRALLDLRELPIPEKPLLTPTELAVLVGTFREAGFSRSQRLAILYRSDPHHGARTFAFISTLRGWIVRAFDDFEKGLLWLSAENKPNSVQGQCVPLKFVKAKTPDKMEKEISTGSSTFSVGNPAKNASMTKT